MLNVRQANANPGLQVDDPGNTWSSHGPGVKNLLLKYYGSATGELTAFVAGKLDLTDTPQPTSSWGSLDNNPDFILSPLQGQFGLQTGIFGVHYNGASSIWASWGCNWGDGAGHFYLLDTPNPNSAANCGTNTRQAFAHLVNRVDFTSPSTLFPSGGVPVAELNQPANLPAGTPLGISPAGSSPTGASSYTPNSGPSPNGLALGTQCSWDPVMVSQNTACYTATGTLNEAGTNCAGTGASEIPASSELGCWVSGNVGAYTITGSGTCTGTSGTYSQVCAQGNGFPQAGSPDFCAAAQHFINAGIASSKDPVTCQLTNFNPTFLANIDSPWTNSGGTPYSDHHLRFMIRNNNPRYTLGNGLMNEINNLFALRPGGGPVVNPTYGGIGLLGSIVFDDSPGHVDDWDMYTMGYGVTGPFGAEFWAGLLSSTSTSVNGPCAGAANTDLRPGNPTFVCNPTLDGILAQQIQTTDPLAYKSFTLAAMNYYGEMAGDLPVYSPGLRIAALTSVGGIVNARGFGYNNPFTLLNAQPNTGYTPVCQGVVTSPCPSGMDYRFGGGDPTTLRYGQAATTDFLNIFQINPFSANGIADLQLINEVYDTLYSASLVDPTVIFCWMCDSTSQSLVNGNTVFHVELRQNLQWHDNQAVDNKDVCFSLLALRDFSQIAGTSGTLLGCTPTPSSSTQMDITFQGQSLSTPLGFSTLLETPIIPRHVWECDVDGIGGYTNTGSSDCTNSQNLLGATPCPGACYNDYTNAGVNVPSYTKIQTNYDVITNNALIGSGPFMCKSLFQSGVIGGGCTKNANGSQGGQAIGPDGTALLTAVTSFHPGLSLTSTPSATASGSGWDVAYTYKVCNTGNTPLNVDITDNVLGSIATGVNLQAGACNNYTKSTFLTATTTNTATASGFDTTSTALVATATATATFTATSTGGAGTVFVDQTPTTGVTTSISGSTPSTPVSVTSTAASPTQPVGTGQISIGLTPTTFLDVHVSGVTTGTATICITNSAVSTGAMLQYWDPTLNSGAGSWVSAANLTISGTQICGDIPVSALNGTPIALVKPTGPNNTRTVVNCNPSSLVVNQPTQCTATVTDTSPTASQPTGMASFNLTPSFDRLSCTLNSGTCIVTLTPTVGSEGTQLVTGAYNGDSSHEKSSGTFNLAVTKRSTSTSVNCSPNFVLPGHSTTCQASVADTSPGTLLTSTGPVDWSSNGAGTFSSTSCNLSITSTCTVTYTPSSTTATVNQQIAAAYQGNTDHFGSSGSTTLAVGIPPKSAVTDSSFCSFDTDSSVYGQQFVLIYPQDQNTPSTYDLVASFPGQFNYNVFYHGTPGTTVSLQIRIPYPFVTQGSSPVQLWGNVGFTSQGCFNPSNKLKGFTTSITSVTLSNYSPQAMGAFASITITGKVPTTGLVYATIQLSYGLKPTTGYTNNNNNAINSNPGKNVPQLQSYIFSFNTVTGDTTQSDSQTIKSENAFFTCIPGFCGIVTNSQGTPVQGVKVQIYYGTSTTQLLATVYTNQYGFYYYSFTLTGTTSAKFTILLPTYNLQQTVTLSPGGFTLSAFVIP